MHPNPYLYGAILFELKSSVRFDDSRKAFRPISELYQFLKERTPVGAPEEEIFDAVNIIGYNNCFNVILEPTAGHCFLLNRKMINKLYKKESRRGRVIWYMLSKSKDLLDHRVSVLSSAFRNIYGESGSRITYYYRPTENFDKDQLAAALLGARGAPLPDAGVVAPELISRELMARHPVNPIGSFKLAGAAALAVFIIGAFVSGVAQAIAAKMVDALAGWVGW